MNGQGSMPELNMQNELADKLIGNDPSSNDLY